MKRFSILLLSLFFSLHSIGQQYYILTGKVIDASTGTPMQGASVFAENTTLGTATDENGTFKLWLPNGGHNITVTYTGYTTASQRSASSDTDKTLDFKLSPVVDDLTDVVVVASNEVKNGWEKYGGFFFDNFIGTSANARSCTIENPQVLQFYFSKRKNRLKIRAKEPLIIHNPYLGYSIRYSLDSFTHEYASGVSFYSGFPLFEDKFKDKELPAFVRSAREKAYNGSVLHFMRSLYNKRLKEDGFEIQFIVSYNEQESAIKLKDFYAALNYDMNPSNATVTIRPNQREVGVIFTGESPDDEYTDAVADSVKRTFQFSILSFEPKTSINIEQNGFFYDQTDVVFKEYWTYEKVGDMVPYDFGIVFDITPAMDQMLKGIFSTPVENPVKE
jgi:hypothetical protein